MPVFQGAPAAALGSCACGQGTEMQYQRHATAIDPASARSGFRPGYTQDDRPVTLFDYATGDDGHGHETVETRVVPIEV